MPSLFRFLVVVGILGVLVYAGIFALATMVEPQPRDITVTVPADRMLKR
ncbi:MAG TPA: histidine kinase [Pseudorhodoplanes sp.]|jgi:putative flippase GtrA|nr:histidine kinase [Pseudorhodoplanes sp.]